jgi:hypothetical protein
MRSVSGSGVPNEESIRPSAEKQTKFSEGRLALRTGLLLGRAVVRRAT